MKNAKIVGLTGNIGTGKSTVAWMFEEMGMPVLDADGIAHEFLAPNTHTWKEIYQRYGNAIMGKDGEIDRITLARIVFQEPTERKWLESLIHPLVKGELEKRATALVKEGHHIIIAEVPLLIEAHWEGFFDAIIVVRCREDQEIERCMQKFNMSREEVLLRLGAQFPLSRKVAAANAVIDNDGTFDETRVQVSRLHQEMVKGLFPKK